MRTKNTMKLADVIFWILGPYPTNHKIELSSIRKIMISHTTFVCARKGIHQNSQCLSSGKWFNLRCYAIGSFVNLNPKCKKVIQFVQIIYLSTKTRSWLFCFSLHKSCHYYPYDTWATSNKSMHWLILLIINIIRT